MKRKGSGMLLGLRTFRKMEIRSLLRLRLPEPKSKPKSAANQNAFESWLPIHLDKTAGSLAGMERWKARHNTVVGFLAPEDVLVVSQCGAGLPLGRAFESTSNMSQKICDRHKKNLTRMKDPRREWRKWSKEQTRTTKQKSKR